MRTPSPRDIRETFIAAVERPSEDRIAWLRTRCANDPDLFQAVAELVAAHERTDGDSWLDEPLPFAHAIRPLGAPLHLGRFEVVTELGRGGMGIVYLAWDPRLRRHVAIKVIHEELRRHPRTVERITGEARRLAALQHDGIATLLDIDEWDGVPILVMAYIAGETLAERLANGPLAPREVVLVGVQLARALAAAHARGILHRDLKPANVKITDACEVKILDFGLATVVHDPESDASTSHASLSTYRVTGTAGYASPEILRHEAATHASDVFALGAVLYECATGSPAFAGVTPIDRMTATIADRWDRRALRCAVAPEVAEVIEACLRPSPAERPAAMGDVHRTLAAAGRGEPTPPRRAPLPRRLLDRLPGARTAAIVFGAIAATTAISLMAATQRSTPEARQTVEHEARVSTSVVAPWSGPVVSVYGLDAGGRDGGSIFARDMASGRLLWSFEPNLAELRAVFGDEIPLEGAFRCRRLEFVDLDGNGAEEMIAVHGHRKWYPAFISAFHPDGQRIGSYYHRGVLRDFLPEDLNKDGTKELIVSGTTNVDAYDGATLFILDETHFHGAAFDEHWRPADPATPLRDCALVRVVAPAFAQEFMTAAGHAQRLDGWDLRTSYEKGQRTVWVDVGFGDVRFVVQLDANLRPLDTALSDAAIGAAMSWPGDLGERFLSDAHVDGWLASWPRFEGGRPAD